MLHDPWFSRLTFLCAGTSGLAGSAFASAEQEPQRSQFLLTTDAGFVLMARGAANQRGPQGAFLNALETIKAVQGELPVAAARKTRDSHGGPVR